MSTSPQDKITLVRGPYTIAPSREWTDVAATWPVCFVSRETRCPDGCGEPHVHGTRRRGWDGGTYETTGPVTELHVVCVRCADLPSVFCLSPSTAGSPYEVCMADLLAGILGHLRRSHPDVVPS